MQRQEIRDQIRAIISDCVAMDAEQIGENSRLVAELGMDSLDFLDIVFGIEKQFAIKLRESEFEKLLRLDILQEKADANEKLSNDEIQAYLKYLPAIGAPELEIGVSPLELFSYITTESLVIAVDEVMH